MRVAASSNLTVELIRAQRFDVAYHFQAATDPQTLDKPCESHDHDPLQRVVDRVELSPEAMSSDPWSTLNRETSDAVLPAADPTSEPSLEEIELGPRRLSPVVGSPALGGLGVALIVTGTLLDVVA
ncbi:MAG: hypothetical protein AAGB26_17360 [Planctomycetota bacterium]